MFYANELSKRPYLRVWIMLVIEKSGNESNHSMSSESDLKKKMKSDSLASSASLGNSSELALVHKKQMMLTLVDRKTIVLCNMNQKRTSVPEQNKYPYYFFCNDCCLSHLTSYTMLLPFIKQSVSKEGLADLLRVLIDPVPGHCLRFPFCKIMSARIE